VREAPVPTTIAAVVFVPEVIPEKGTLVAEIVEVQVGATPAPDEIKNCPVVPGRLPGIKAPVRLRFPPSVVRLFPDTVKVLSKVVAPWRVNAPGVVTDPIVFTEEAPPPIVLLSEAPLPKVLVSDAPVPMVELPLDVSVVNAPDPGVVLPIGPGAAKVAPFRELALRLATLVVEATTNGAVPVARVEVN
jgi:hypothetical protein